MIRFNLRLRRTFILWWLLGMWAFLLITPPSYVATYPDLASRGPVVASVQSNMGTQAMYGHLPSPGTIGQLTTWETGAWLCLLSAVMMVLLFSSLYRKSESSGLSEHFYAAGYSRASQLRAALSTGALIAVIHGAMCAAILIAFRYLSIPEITVAGSLAFGTALFLTMLSSLALTSMVHSLWGRGANFNRIGLLGVGTAFLIRMVADTSTINGIHYLNWITPLGWRSLINPFTNNNWAVCIILFALCIALIGIAFLLDTQRAYNSRILRISFPRRHQKLDIRVRGLFDLNLRIHRSNILAWSIVIGLILLTMLPLINSLLPSLQNDPATMQAIETLMPAGDLQTTFIIYVFQIASILLSIATVQPIISFVRQERLGLIDTMRSTGVRRWSPLWGSIAISFSTLSSCTVFAIIGAFLGLFIQPSAVEGGTRIVLLASLSIAIHALFPLGLATVLAGLVPRLIHLAWIPIITASVVSLFGPVLSLSESQMDLSPLNHSWAASGEPIWPLFCFMVTGGTFLAIGLLGMQRRDLL
ncbi:ABC transporter permease [Corynebacterium crudilactis]|uniref:ABC transporter permease n=1 Tax=Corynebacterium crudilactis TaxID=1652495 RepID=A0A172QWR6_9CORY|nr:ABC transporter permease [Corynebacterium crudilactis]ANE05155.1 ABC transporter permease [Corynebacterium crudilactis]